MQICYIGYFIAVVHLNYTLSIVLKANQCFGISEPSVMVAYCLRAVPLYQYWFLKVSWTVYEWIVPNMLAV